MLTNDSRNQEKNKKVTEERALILLQAEKRLSTVFYFNLEDTFKHERTIRTLQRGAELELGMQRDELIVKSSFHMIGKIPSNVQPEITKLLKEKRRYHVTVLNILGRDGTNYESTTIIEGNQEKIVKHLGVEILIEFPII